MRKGGNESRLSSMVLRDAIGLETLDGAWHVFATSCLEIDPGVAVALVAVTGQPTGWQWCGRHATRRVSLHGNAELSREFPVLWPLPALYHDVG